MNLNIKNELINAKITALTSPPLYSCFLGKCLFPNLFFTPIYIVTSPFITFLPPCDVCQALCTVAVPTLFNLRYDVFDFPMPDMTMPLSQTSR